MIGSTDSTRTRRLYGNAVRVTINANASPSPVDNTAQSVARISVFQATPQRVLPVMHEMPQIFCVKRRARKAERENAPSLSCAAWMRIFMTGKNVNAVTSNATATTLPATNASPLKNPRSATPTEKSIANAVAVNVAPSPIPYWPAANADETPNDSNANPRGPIAKP